MTELGIYSLSLSFIMKEKLRQYTVMKFSNHPRYQFHSPRDNINCIFFNTKGNMYIVANLTEKISLDKCILEIFLCQINLLLYLIFIYIHSIKS